MAIALLYMTDYKQVVPHCFICGAISVGFIWTGYRGKINSAHLVHECFVYVHSRVLVCINVRQMYVFPLLTVKESAP